MRKGWKLLQAEEHQIKSPDTFVVVGTLPEKGGLSGGAPGTSRGRCGSGRQGPQAGFSPSCNAQPVKGRERGK